MMNAAEIRSVSGILSPERLGLYALRAMLEEAYTTPKPGLVDILTQGAHTDMDVHTFEKSASAICPYFTEMACAGADPMLPPSDLFPTIRRIGRDAELAMYRATGGVNTHKGLIFALGLFVTAASRLTACGMRVTAESLQMTEQSICARTLEKELLQMKFGRMGCASARDNVTHGLDNLRRYGTSGARGEAIGGYPSVFYCALPVMLEGIREHRNWNRIKLQTLLALMAETDDSNILSRTDPDTLHEVQQDMKNFLQSGGAYRRDAYVTLTEMDRLYSERRISAGGCADLLAVSIFLMMILEKPAA